MRALLWFSVAVFMLGFTISVVSTLDWWGIPICCLVGFVLGTAVDVLSD